MEDFTRASIGYTDYFPDSFKFIWKIENIALPEYSNYDQILVTSPMFSDTYHNCSWSAQLITSKGDKIACRLKYKVNTSSNITNVFINCTCFYKIVIFDELCLVKFSRTRIEEDFQNIPFSLCDIMYRHEFFNFLERNNNNLTVGFELSIRNVRVDKRAIPDYKIEFDPGEHLLEVYNVLENCLVKEQWTDVKLITNDGELEAHKIILASKSPVFLAMFNCNMKENRENIVEIKGVDKDVMKDVLQFIYTDKIKLSPERVHDIFKCAHEYSISALQEVCAQFISITLSLENFFDIFHLAALYEFETLTRNVCSFLAVHKYVIHTTEFKKISKSYPVFINNVIKNLDLPHQHN